MIDWDRVFILSVALIAVPLVVAVLIEYITGGEQ